MLTPRARSPKAPRLLRCSRMCGGAVPLLGGRGFARPAPLGELLPTPGTFGKTRSTPCAALAVTPEGRASGFLLGGALRLPPLLPSGSSRWGSRARMVSPGPFPGGGPVHEGVGSRVCGVRAGPRHPGALAVAPGGFLDDGTPADGIGVCPPGWVWPFHDGCCPGVTAGGSFVALLPAGLEAVLHRAEVMRADVTRRCRGARGRTPVHFLGRFSTAQRLGPGAVCMGQSHLGRHHGLITSSLLSRRR